MAVDWLTIRNDYINGGGSYRKLAEKYKVSFNTLRDRAIKEEWKKAKDKQQDKIATKTEQKTAEKISDNQSEIAAIKSRIELDIFRQLEARLSAQELDGPDFRRLVQSYVDMRDSAQADTDAIQSESFTRLLAALDGDTK